MTTISRTIGAPVSRVEGMAKVTGQARYAADNRFDEDLLHGVVAASRIARGTIVALHRDEVMQWPGVLAVIDYSNAPHLNDVGDAEALQFQTDRVSYRGQPIALVVADTPQRARAAAEALVVEYAVDDHDVVLTADHPKLYRPAKVNPANITDTEQGDVDAQGGRQRRVARDRGAAARSAATAGPRAQGAFELTPPCRAVPY
jgi:xanthine dehydrogenase YagR molybdenum-binding subunit